MTTKLKIKKAITDAQLKDEIIGLFETGSTKKQDVLGQLQTRYKIGRTRFFNIYPDVYSDWAKQKEKAQADQVHANTAKALKSGLKSKIDRQLEIQKEIDDLKALLDQGYIIRKIEIEGAKPVEKKEVFGAYEITSIHKVINAKRAELSKMDGDYAASKVETTITGSISPDKWLESLMDE